MYNRTNPAVIKSILLRLTKNELIQEIQFMRSQIEELEASNKRNMFISLQGFALNHLPFAKTTNYKL
ncbi:MAG: hypothetical protein HYR91_02965 [Flavobacteriia bacterium]|nr:hypothetical protein [Flavobacteriia bacterium]